MESTAKRPCTLLLEEKVEENFHPREEELLEYATWLGMKIPQDMDLIWIARDGLTQPLPKEWKPCQTEDDEIYYFNFETGESVWDHPCDGFYRFSWSKKEDCECTAVPHGGGLEDHLYLCVCYFTNCRNLYQEECKRLGKNPCQMLESAECSSSLQHLSNQSDDPTHVHGADQVHCDDILNEKGRFSPRISRKQICMDSERMPSNKEIQMNIVETEINALKDIRSQLLQKMSSLWQEEDSLPLNSNLLLQKATDYNGLERERGSLLEEKKDKFQSKVDENFMELHAQPSMKDWSKIQVEEARDPTGSKRKPQMLSNNQLEMSKLVPTHLISKMMGENFQDHCGEIFKDDSRYYNQNNEGVPVVYPSKVSQESNEHHLRNKGKNILNWIEEDSKKEEQLDIDETKPKTVFQVREPIDTIESSVFDKEQEFDLTRKKENLNLLRKELSKGVEFELLLEEESLLKRKKEEMLKRLHSQRLHYSINLENNGYKASKSTQVDNHIEEDLKELFLQWRSEIKNEIVGLEKKLNDILIAHSKLNQLNFEALPLPSIPIEDICKSNESVPLQSTSHDLFCTLQKIFSELHTNLKHLFEERELGSNAKNLIKTVNTKLKPNDYQSRFSNQYLENAPVHNLCPEVIFSDTFAILKEFLVVLDGELQESINHHEKMAENQNLKHLSINLTHKAVDASNESFQFSETLNKLKRLVQNLEYNMTSQIPGKGGSQDGILAHQADPTMSPLPEHEIGAQFISLNKDINKKMWDKLDTISQFKAISSEVLCSLTELFSKVEGELKDNVFHCKRPLNGLRLPCESTSHGHCPLKDQHFSFAHDIIKTVDCLASGDATCFKRLSSHNLGVLERFIGTLHHKLKYHLSYQGKKAHGNSICLQSDRELSKESTLDHDTNFHAQRIIHREQQQISFHGVCNESAVSNEASTALSSDSICKLAEFADELHPKMTTSHQDKGFKYIKDPSSKSCVTRAFKDTDISDSQIKQVATQCVFPREDNKLTAQDNMLELQTLSTKILQSLEKFQRNLDIEWSKRSLLKRNDAYVDTAITDPKNLNLKNSPPSLEGSNVKNDNNLAMSSNNKKTLDKKLPSFPAMCTNLKRFIIEVEDWLRAKIKKCPMEVDHANDRMESEMKGNEQLHEFNSETEERELDFQQATQILKAQSSEIEKSMEHLLQYFKNQLMEEIRLPRVEKDNVPGTIIQSKSGHQPQHLTQVQTLVAEEKRIWCDILNDATKQWLQKEWIERLECQSDLTCNPIISLKSFGYLNQVQNVLGKEKKIDMYGILNHDSTQNWLIRQRISHVGTTFKIKDNIEDSIPSHHHRGFNDTHLPIVTTEEKSCILHSSCEGTILEENQIEARSQCAFIYSFDENHQSKTSTHDFEAMRCLPYDLNQTQSNSFTEHRQMYTQEVRKPQRCQKGDQFSHKTSVRKKNLSSISQWISMAKSFGDFKQLNNDMCTLEGHLSKENKRQNAPSSCEVYNAIDLKQIKKSRHTYGSILTSRQDEKLELNPEVNLNETGITGEVHENHQRMLEPTNMGQFKLMSKRVWQTLQPEIRILQATQRAHIMALQVFQQIHCCLILEKDSTSCICAFRRSMKTLIRKMMCGKTYPYNPESSETFGPEDMTRVNHEGGDSENKSKHTSRKSLVAIHI